ncbi:aminopeptidase N [Nocardioides sp. GY 10127]|uniref:aminopeptidase N n=1 Tax=Nocardioides sp. GY 10127 TaxID=2569762 RepID=UPI0010A81EDE|nr:aminopeptidase N [Nocardioides sp. GY 10127]TIC80726.1 aminopeptidase N [Nocardioides sp. GY 10127]
MPGTNLTRDEAATRAALLDVTSYTIDLDLTTGDKTFASTTTISFTATTPGASTFADLVGAVVHEITLNGESLDPSTVHVDDRLELTGLQAENTLVVRADCAYSHTGEGLHRFVDPADGRVYLYSQFEVPDARRVFTTFEQPDLKSVFTFNVTAPEDWKVVSNSPSPAPQPLGDGKALFAFAPTQRMSTYITALVAGEYHEVQDVYEGKYGTIPLGHYCRQSLVPYLDTEELVKLTRQGFAFFEEAFDYPYPFGKYDQLYVPEYNMGAMENAGCVTLRDEYLPRSRQPRSFYEFRCSVILHEMAHMWFGDLVTMKWWDDLWLNESFAEWACYHAEVEATEYTDSWTGFANARKQTGYRQDQLPSTHPIAADNFDLHAVEVNFDMITYAKGASVLKQLVAWVGIDDFMAGLRQYFKDHAFGNSEFTDLLSALEKASGRELAGWAEEWLRTAGVNTLAPEFELDAEGAYSRLAVRQTAHADWPTLRRHRIGIGLYDEVGGRLVRRTYVETDVEGALTEVPELVGEKQPDLLLLNDSDHTYAKIRLDERSLATAVSGLSKLDDSLARALVWGAAWDMTRDAEMAATDYVDLVLANIGAETDAWGVSRIPSTASTAAALYTAPEHREEVRSRWEKGMHALALAAEPGSDSQLTFVRTWAASARSEESLAALESLLDGAPSLDGLAVDQDLRWSLVTALAAAGRAGTRIDDELAADATISGQEHAAAARASQPDAAAKAEAWRAGMLDASTPNETARSIVLAFMRAGQDDVLAPYVAEYLEVAGSVWENLGTHRASVALNYAFPTVLASPELEASVQEWLATTTAPVPAVRFVREGLADVQRALAAQARDAQA